MTRSVKVEFHLPFIYGEKARNVPVKEEQVNRMNSFWFCEAQRSIPMTDASDERVEGAPTKKKAGTMVARASAYLAENRRLDTLLRRKNAQPPVKKKTKKPRIMHDMIALEYRYQKSAKVVQRAWRRFSQRTFWQRYFATVHAATVIQRRIRGVLCRKYVAVWVRSRLRFVSKIQAVYRGHLTRRILATKIEWEQYNANVIQRWTRGFFGRRRAVVARQTMAALHIQCLWRGFHSRKRSDRLWLGAKVTRLQSLSRGYFVRKHTLAMAARYHDAAVAIQKMFRGTLARTRVDDILRDRETHNRKVVMDVLDAEIGWHKEYMEKLQRRLAKTKLETRVVDLEGDLYRLHQQVGDLECIYLDMMEQKAKMSPRAITDGWVSEMEDKMTKQRAMITAAKFDAVFGTGLDFKRSEAELQERRASIEKIAFRTTQLKQWRAEEFMDYWGREMQELAIRRDVARRRNIAEQRRKWTFKFYTKSGKIQVHKPTARVDTTFCIGGTDLLALQRPKPTAVDALADQVKLVTVEAQLTQAKAMFNPLLVQFSSTHGAVHELVKTKPPPPPRPVEIIPNNCEPIDTPSSPNKRKMATNLSSALPGQLEPKTKPRTRKMAAKPMPKSANVPWSLLDQLEAEKAKFKTEKTMHALGFDKRKKKHP
ncbi:Aste57867_21175 [Aphanomyces stellatus]|uniref:Aste57867_21175 protein n=1 Tax=Aphanomyces stellatus TaxID=120398 RepID=A0A485LGY2_9STRA|nr:hypothetical protein As57867_021107 [Aphanomyces stellatus]VFT97849.1 Aste57867_21175 [Aphanomyces stellatus]